MTHEDMAAELRVAGWRVQPPLTQENCPHLRNPGSAGINYDGSGYSEWWCADCGKHVRHEWPASASPLLVSAWN